MIVDIFSSFDPSTNIFFIISPLFWLFRVSILITTRGAYWISLRQYQNIIGYLLDIMETQRSRTFTIHLKGLTGIICLLFFMLVRVNFLGLIPYVFSYSRHIVYSLLFGLPLWLLLIISNINNSFISFIGGLLPRGAPSWLNPFLVLVETVSILVRPITLSVRLVANMSAGHIVLSLISIYSSYFLFIVRVYSIILLRVQVFYRMFEMGICLIQGYIFCLLITLYSDDHRY